MSVYRDVLIVTDVQKDFCPGGALAVKDGDAVVPVINKILKQEKFDRVVATQDWHPRDQVSFASNHRREKALRPDRDRRDLPRPSGPTTACRHGRRRVSSRP